MDLADGPLQDVSFSLPDPHDVASQNASGAARGEAQHGSTVKRRASKACRRCRRMRSRCVLEMGNPVCQACAEAGCTDCVFPGKGETDNDRGFRRPRSRKAKRPKAEASAMYSRESGVGASQHGAGADGYPQRDWENMPPLPEVIDGVGRSMRCYTQLGFLDKNHFLYRLRSSSLALSKRYGGRLQASRYFRDRASHLASRELAQAPTLEGCQAFFLLSMAYQSTGESTKSYVNLKIAASLATLLRLHKEESYHLSIKVTPEITIRSESARRTLWLMHSQDLTGSSPSLPATFNTGDITTLLPCDEADFAEGRVPGSRAALQDTLPALNQPALVRDPKRSMLASLLQARYLWVITARRSIQAAEEGGNPSEHESEYSQLACRLRDWEDGLPLEHTWHKRRFQKYKTHEEHLGFLEMTMTLRLCNIVLRRPFLRRFLVQAEEDRKLLEFFRGTAAELFCEVARLFEQIEALFSGTPPEDSIGARTAGFSVYNCALLSAYLQQHPLLFRDVVSASNGPRMFHRAISILEDHSEVWPLASRWIISLQTFVRESRQCAAAAEGLTADGHDHAQSALLVSFPAVPATTTDANVSFADQSESSRSASFGEPLFASSFSSLDSNFGPATQGMMTPQLSNYTNNTLFQPPMAEGVGHALLYQHQQQQQQQPFIPAHAFNLIGSMGADPSSSIRLTGHSFHEASTAPMSGIAPPPFRRHSQPSFPTPTIQQSLSQGQNIPAPETLLSSASVPQFSTPSLQHAVPSAEMNTGARAPPFAHMQETFPRELVKDGFDEELEEFLTGGVPFVPPQEWMLAQT